MEKTPTPKHTHHCDYCAHMWLCSLRADVEGICHTTCPECGKTSIMAVAAR